MTTAEHVNGTRRPVPGSKPYAFNAAAEASILGGVILQNEALADLDTLEPDDFYDWKHRLVFEAMRNLHAAGKPIDTVTIEVEIDKQGKIDAIGGPAFLGELVLRVPTPDNIRTYRDDVLLAAKNRRLQIALASAAERAKNWPHDPAELFAEVLGDVQRIEVESRLGGAVAKGTYGGPYREWLGDTEPGNDPQDIFDVHGLIVRAEPCIFLGDPKVGKTLVIEDLALHMASGRRSWCETPIYRRCKVLALLREDSERTTRRRFFQMARGAGIEHWELDGWLEVDGITPLYFDESRHVAQLARQLKNFDVVLIDSLSTIHNGDENSVESMAPIMNQWRDLSLTTNTAIAIIHHFRKPAGGAPTAATGSVLQRARGSSIIGATTRHAVGISAGPERGQVVVDIESNHDVDVEPFVVARKAGTTASGHRFLTHERVGSVRDAKAEADAAMIDPITLRVVRAAGPDGVSARDLRTYVNEELKMARGEGCRPVRVDASARRLADQSLIEHLEFAKKWRARS